MIEELYQQLGELPASLPRVVLHQDGTAGASKHHRTSAAMTVESIDSLFGNSLAYVTIKKEKHEHRLMLWAALKGHSKKELAAMFEVSYQTVCNVMGQPWFKAAFVSLSTELGKDAAETFLRGQEMPSLQTLETLRDDPNTPANVKANIANSFLDRIRGKPTVFVETKSSSSVDITVADVSSLLAERAQNEQRLRANGILSSTNN